MVFVKERFDGSSGKTWSNWLPWALLAEALFLAITNVPYNVGDVCDGEEEGSGKKCMARVMRIGGMIVGLLVLTSGEEEDLIKASHSNSQLEPLSSPPVEDVLEDTDSLDSSDSEPPAFLEFVHVRAKTLFDALHQRGAESPQAFSRDQICAMV